MPKRKLIIANTKEEAFIHYMNNGDPPDNYEEISNEFDSDAHDGFNNYQLVLRNIDSGKLYAIIYWNDDGSHGTGEYKIPIEVFQVKAKKVSFTRYIPI